MDDQQQRLIERAKKKYDTIYPCCGKTEWKECFTQESEKVILWFNAKDNSTRVETENTRRGKNN